MALADSLKALDLKRLIREADIAATIIPKFSGKCSDISENSEFSEILSCPMMFGAGVQFRYRDDSFVIFFSGHCSIIGPLLADPQSVKQEPFGLFDLEKKKMKSFFAVSAIMLLSATSGMAQSAATKACAGDVKSLCAGIQPGDGRVKACIKSHFSDVSASCQAVLVKAAAISKACSADVKKVCSDVKPGGGRIEACMKSHLSEVSDACKDAVTQAAAGKS
jgi:hypothetical protein